MGDTLFLNGEIVSTEKYLGGGICTSAFLVEDKRFTGGYCVYAFTRRIDYSKEALVNSRHRNPHLPTVKRVGVGYYSGEWGIVYRMPLYTVLREASIDDSNKHIYSTYKEVDRLSYKSNDYKHYEAAIKRNKKLPAAIRHALCILGKAIMQEQKAHNDTIGLWLDAHNGNGALDENGNLVLLDIFNVVGGYYGDVEPNTKLYDAIGLDISNWKKWKKFYLDEEWRLRNA